MRYLIGAAVTAIALTIGSLSATAAVAQTSAVNNPARKYMTPDQIRRGTHNKFTQEFDVRKLTDPMYASEVHGQADTIAKCVAKRGGDKAGGYIGGELLGDPEYARIGEALLGRFKRCIDTDASAPAIAISGALAEELVVAKAPHFEDRAAGVSEDTARKFFGDLTGQVTIDKLAGCLAVYSPGLAYKVVQTKAGSSEETAALAALYKQTPECGLSSTPASIPVLYQRGAIAAALYKWSAQAS